MTFSFLQLARAEASVAVSAIVQASTPEAQNAGGLSTAQNPEAPHDDSVDVNVRNFATVINAVRILQKLVKRRPERIATLLKFKAVVCLMSLDVSVVR